MNFLAHITADDFSAAVHTLDAAIPGIMDAQIRAALARIVAMGQDSHTFLDLGSGSRRCRFSCKRFTDGWYLTGVYPSIATNWAIG
jgi:hypothetical protein